MSPAGPLQVTQGDIEAAIAAHYSEIGTTGYDVVIRVPSRSAEIHVAPGTTPDLNVIWNSATKPLVAAVMLHQVQQGVIALDDLAVDLIPGWAGTGDQNLVALRHALAFCSGCASGQMPAFSASDQAAYEAAVADLPTHVAEQTPGTVHLYDTDHEDISGVMVQKAMGAADWQEVWDAFVTATGHFASFTLEGPITSAARKATGPASEFADWLEEVLLGTALDGGTLLDEYTSDQVDQTTLAQQGKPLLIASEIGEDWHFAFGWWLEDRHSIFAGPVQTPYPRMSTVGLSGQYCSVDYEHGYLVVIGPCFPSAGAGQSYLDTGPWFRRHLEGLIELWIRQGCPA